MEKLKYLRGKSWSEITREERYFCADLYFDIKKNPQIFIYFLNKKFKFNFNVNQGWEVEYEVYSVPQKLDKKMI